MEWWLLVCIVPAIVIPVILFFGFAGCGFSVTVEGGPPPEAPTIVSAVPKDGSTVTLTLMNPNMNQVTFQFQRKSGTESTPAEIATSDLVFDDTALEAGETYWYRVRAVGSDGQESEWSSQATVTTFGVAFEVPLTTDQSGLENYCIIQRIDPSPMPPKLIRSGNLVKIRVRGNTQEALTLGTVSISQPVADGSGDPYDAAGDFVKIVDTADVPANTAVVLPAVAYTLDQTKPLLIAFDILDPGNVRFAGDAAFPDWLYMHFQQGVAEAAQPDRTSGFQRSDKNVYLVDRIEVASKWPTT